jgi:excisionase family DNA binding protein
MPIDQILNVRGAAQLLNLKPGTVYKLTERAEIPFYKLSGGKFGHLRFSMLKLKAWLELKAVPVSSGVLADKAEVIEESVKPKPWGEN